MKGGGYAERPARARTANASAHLLARKWAHLLARKCSYTHVHAVPEHAK
jgi:hypothetical protein